MPIFQDKKIELFLKQQTKLIKRRRKRYQVLGTLYESINETKDAILMGQNFVVKSEIMPEIKDPFDSYKEEELVSEVDTEMEKKLQEQLLLCNILAKKINMKKTS